MAFLNESVPHFECYVRKEFLYNLETGHGEFIKGVCFGVNSLENRALGWHVLLENGACFWRLPLHALCWRTDAPPIELNDAQLWDNISSTISVTSFSFMKLRTCDAYLASGAKMKAQYMFTIDYANSSYAESPNEHKCSHILKANDGNFLSLPNNRILWDDASMGIIKQKPDYTTNTHVFTCENNLTSEDSDKWFYDVNEVTNGK